MVVIMAAAVAVLVMLMMMVMMLVRMLDFFLAQEGVVLLDGAQNETGLQLVPRGGDDGGSLIVLADQLDALVDLVLVHVLGTAEQDGLGALDLIAEELAEVADIHLALDHVDHSSAAAQLQVMGFGSLGYHAADVGQLAHAGRLDDDAVRMIGVDQFADGLAEVAHQRAADASAVQLRHLNAGILHEAAVNADFAVFVLQQNHFFALKGAGNQLLDERGLARAQEAGNNMYFRHLNIPPCQEFLP